MQKYEKMDRRVEKTRNAIINAFKEMIIEKEFKEITIKELAERANINRKTFYLHYDSMDDILFDMTVEMADQLFEILEEKHFFESFHIDIFIDTMNELLNKDIELYKKILCASSYRFFSRNIKDIVKESFIRKIRNRTNLSPQIMNLCGEYVASGLAKLLKVWFENPQNISQQQITELAGVLIFGGVNGAIIFCKGNH